MPQFIGERRLIGVLARQDEIIMKRPTAPTVAEAKLCGFFPEPSTGQNLIGHDPPFRMPRKSLLMSAMTSLDKPLRLAVASMATIARLSASA